jgi:transposase InsO family protein
MGNLTEGTWILDGGASCSIVCSPEHCSNVRPADITIHVGGGKKLHCTSIGDLHLKRELLGGTISTIRISDVRIVPRFGVNILAEHPFLKKGCNVSKSSENGKTICTIRSAAGDIVLRSVMSPGKLFILGPPRCENAQQCASGASHCLVHSCCTTEDDNVLSTRSFSEKDALEQWHCRLGHRNFEDVARLLRERGIPFKMPKTTPFCAVCTEAKSSRHPLKRSNAPRERAPRPGYMLHSDNCGPFSVSTRGNGYRWFNLLIDDHSGKIWLKLMTHQPQFMEHLRDTVKEIETEKSSLRVIARFHADCGTYFEKSHELREFCAKQGIRRSYIPPYTPAMNAVAERAIRTICEMARAMLIQSHLPGSFWGEAVTYAVYILNNLPYKARSNDTRNSKFFETDPPDKLPTRIVPFGCAGWAHEHHSAKQLHLSKAIEGIVVGWDKIRCCYRLVSIGDYAHVSFSGHVTTNHDIFPAAKTKGDDGSSLHRTEFMVDNDQCRARQVEKDVEDHQAPIDLEEQEQPTIAASRTRRVWTPSEKNLQALASAAAVPPTYGSPEDAAFYIAPEELLASRPDNESATTVSSMPTDPPSWKAAMALDEGALRAEWVEAGRSEYTSHVEVN